MKKNRPNAKRTHWPRSHISLSQPCSRYYNYTILTHNIQNSPFILRWTTELCYVLRWYLYVNYRFAGRCFDTSVCSVYARAIRLLVQRLLLLLLLRSICACEKMWIALIEKQIKRAQTRAETEWERTELRKREKVREAFRKSTQNSCITWYRGY